MTKTSSPSENVPPPSPPFITVEGIPNFRDLGGYSISGSKTHSVRRDLVYRCGEPSLVTKDGVTTMQQLGITHIYDLRSNNEIERNLAAGRGGVVEWDGCERVFVPVFADEDYSPEKLAVRYKHYTSGTEGFTRAYTDILHAAPSSYRTILLHLATKPSTPLIIHCTAGKDRTGVICALILSLCGVPDEVVAYEYSLTEVGLTNEWKQGVISHLNRFWVASNLSQRSGTPADLFTIVENPALKGNMEGALNMIGSKAENMLSTLKVIGEEFRGVENYLTEKCGLTKEEIESIKSNLVIEQPSSHQKAQYSL